MKKEIIVLSGNVGVGKTTLGSIISKSMNIPWISESQIYDSFKYLAATNSKKEKFITQIAFPVNRLAIILSAFYENNHEKRIITERFLWDDLIFYKVWDSIYGFDRDPFYGCLNETLCQLCNIFFIKTIYLKCDIEIIENRVLSRNKLDDYQFTKEIISKIENEYKFEIKKSPDHIWAILDVSKLDMYDKKSMFKFENIFNDIINSNVPVVNWAEWV